MSMLKLRAMLGDYPNTMALKRGEVKSDLVSLEFVKADVPHDQFKQVIAGDDELDDLEIKIDEEATQYISLRAPVAGDSESITPG